jgi:hypothetical protein
MSIRSVRDFTSLSELRPGFVEQCVVLTRFGARGN